VLVEDNFNGAIEYKNMPSLEREMVVKQSNLVDLVLKVEDSSRERHSGAQNFLPLT
jgi:hypothetical protein